MRRFGVSFLVMMAISLVSVAAQEAEEQPTDIGQTEAVEVRLVLIEILVMDQDGRTVAGLTREDFQLTIEGTVSPIETLDVSCPAGSIDDPEPIAPDQRRGPVPAPDAPRKIVFFIDYYHLGQRDRVRVIEAAQSMVRQSKPADEQMMVVALADGLRIEQRFTKNADEVIDTLERMKYDLTLFAAEFGASTGRSYFESLSTLMDVLAAYEGAKAVVFFSAILSRGDLQVDWFDDVIERAASARTVVYPAYARWFDFPTPRRGTHRLKGTAGGQRVLPKLAAGTGGRTPPSTDDLSLSYARAQRDFACHYALGFRIRASEAVQAHKLSVGVLRPGYDVRHPMRVRLWSEEQRRQSRLRAAFADPEQFENPLIRAFAFPVRPRSAKSWDTLLAFQFPMPETKGDAVELRATLKQIDKPNVYSFEREIPAGGPRAPEASERPVTVLRDSTLKTGPHRMTVALSEPGREDVFTRQVGFAIPEVPRDTMFVRGPILARVLREGVLVAASDDPTANGPALNQILGDAESVELLLVHEVEADDTVLSYWETCLTGKQRRPGAVVERRVVDEDGKLVHSLDPVTVPFRETGAARCGGRFDKLAAGTLRPGEYRLEVIVVDQGANEELARKSVPLLVEGVQSGEGAGAP